MIEVTCQQAHRLIREARDRRIPEEQWALLQAHLEVCPDCRAYRANLENIEHSLGRVLGARWQPLLNSQTDYSLSKVIRQQRQSRAEQRKWAGYVVLGLLVLLLLGGYGVYQRQFAPPAPAVTPAGLAEQQITPTATKRAPGAFRGTLAVETHRNGNTDIELLLPGPDGVPEWENLTGNPAQDTNPAWSPDGEWLAFLSDRTGKDEVFIISIAGSRLTQLTNSPEVTWRGPLAWSADGQWLALSGVHADTGDTAMYLVPMNGQGARSLAFTRGAAGPPVFTPQGQVLTFQSAADSGSLLLYDLDRVQFASPTQIDDERDWMRAANKGAYDWSPVRSRLTRLAYLAEGPYNPYMGLLPETSAVTQLRVTQAIQPGRSSGTMTTPNQVVASASGQGGLRGVSWAPGGDDSFLAYLQVDQDVADCWRLHLHRFDDHHTDVEVPGLCIDRPPDHSSWSSDGQWLVLLARQSGQAQPAYYALRVTADFINGLGASHIERLYDLDAPDMGSAGSITVRVRPTLPPGAPLLRILPRATQPPDHLGPPSALPPLPGRLVYDTSELSKNHVITMLPDGSSRTELLGEPYQYSCPSWSPDRKQLAYVSHMANIRNMMAVYRLSADGGQPFPLTTPAIWNVSPSERQVYGCPVWSPDGKQLAVVLRTAVDARLAVIPNPPEGENAVPFATYYDVGTPSALTSPVWSPDGKQLILASIASAKTPARISLIDFAQKPAQIRTLVESDGWQDIYGLAFSPDGSQIAYIATRYNRAQTVSFQLYRASRGGRNLMEPINLPDSDMASWLEINPLTWLPDGRLAFLIRHRPDALYKTDIYLLDPAQSGRPQPFLSLPDLVFDLAWSPGAPGWLIYSSDAGLYVLDANAIDAGRSAAPVLLNKDKAYALDWR